MNLAVFKKGWSLLEAREKRHAVLVLGLVVLSAATSAMMVGSIMPFLSTLADPNRIRDVAIFAKLYEIGGFQSDYGFLVALGLASLLVIVIANLIQALRVYLVVRFATMRMHTLSTRLLAVYLRQPYEYFLDKHSGELSTQILAETQKVVENFYRPAAEVIASGLTVFAIVALLLWINAHVAIIVFVVAGGIYVGSFAVSRKAVTRHGETRAAANRNRFRVANEALAGLKEVKLLGREAYYVGTYSSASIRMAKAEALVGVISQHPLYIMQVAAFGGMIVLTLALLEPSELNGGRGMGTLLPLLGVFAFAGQRLIPELAKLYAGATQLNYGAAVVKSIYSDLQCEKLLSPLPSTDIAPMGLKQSLQLSEVSYAYPNAKTAGLAGASIRIRAGERIGIVGGSGSGKTTLADVIMGLLRPESGHIAVDGTKIANENMVSWQRSVGYVQQGIFLSDASIIENIALGVPLEQIDRERVCKAAHMARLDGFVRQNLPEGYDTKVGERGVRLSGGQRQRIAIARALYNDADLIVFDEATSALDNITEKQVMESIDGLPGNKTVILIAHRLSTLQTCDRLVVMDQGKVVGIGTWSELMENNAHFQRLASSPAPGPGVN